MLARASVLRTCARGLSAKIPPPRLFNYEQVISTIHVSDAIEAVEKAFGALAKGKVQMCSVESSRFRRAPAPTHW